MRLDSLAFGGGVGWGDSVGFEVIVGGVGTGGVAGVDGAGDVGT